MSLALLFASGAVLASGAVVASTSPHFRLPKLVSANGYGAMVYANDRVSDFFPHLYQEYSPGVVTPDVLYDTYFGVVSDADRRVPVFGLPGNPVSSLVSYELLARPGLWRLLGRPDPVRTPVRAVAAERLGRRVDGIARIAGPGQRQHQHQPAAPHPGRAKHRHRAAA